MIFSDAAMSGTRRDRPDFDRLMKLVQTNGIDVIVTESGDRLSRDLGDADRVWKLIDFYKVRLICLSDGIDSANFRVKAMFADEFLVDLGKKTCVGSKVPPSPSF